MVYQYPDNVITSARLGKYVSRGCDLVIDEDELEWTGRLDQQKEDGKSLFGSGFLVSDRVARKLKDSLAREIVVGKEVVEYRLSEREEKIVKDLSKKAERRR